MEKMLLPLRKITVMGVIFLGWAAQAPAVTPARETPVVRVVRENSDSVVNISTERVVFLREAPFWGRYGSEFDVFFDEFFGFHQRGAALKLKSVGSGVIVDPEGLVVTNAHVVNMASGIYVVLNDGTTLKGRLVYENPDDELAIIKMEPVKPLSAAVLGSTQDLMIGETAIAIGNPLGLENSVCAGIISGKNRKFASPFGGFGSENLIQTDAPINPGNSGGALLNLDGELIGINVAVVLNSQGIGFAIPVEKVKEALEAYRRRGQAAPAPQKTGKKAAARPHEEAFSFEEEVDEEAWGLFGEPRVDIREEKTGYVVRVDIAGLDKKKIKVDVGGRSVTISGERSEEKEERAAGGYYKTRRVSSFLKTIPLPEDADIRGVKTRMRGDELTITVSKKKGALR